jgi:hypothetical protein
MGMALLLHCNVILRVEKNLCSWLAAKMQRSFAALRMTDLLDFQMKWEAHFSPPAEFTSAGQARLDGA